MERTAVILNAGIGDLAVGLSSAGFKILAAYEPDEKAVKIHEMNMGFPVFCRSISDIAPAEIPQAALLAIRLYASRGYAEGKRAPQQAEEAHRIRKILLERRPRAFVILMDRRMAVWESHPQLYDYLKDAIKGYFFWWQEVDAAEMTGMPVRQKFVCVIGITDDLNQYKFPQPALSSEAMVERYLQLDGYVDPWYYRIRKDIIPNQYDGLGLYCWSKNAYGKSDVFRWNSLRSPLVRDRDGLRRITHREIANFKAFPEAYRLGENRDRSWLYQKLVQAKNILAIRMIADSVVQAMDPDPWRTQRQLKGRLFEDLFYKYLQQIKESAPAEIQIGHGVRMQDETQADFMVSQNGAVFLFELKWYNGKFILRPVANAVCARLMSRAQYGASVLAVANVAPAALKKECLEKYHVHIWDICNLLWLFNDFPDIKNELVAALGYSVDDLLPEQPDQVFLPREEEEKAAKVKREETWEERLEKIAPGKDDFGRYEDVCTDILKYVLGDYLTLWERQEKSNDGLYRFDLCCKIKNGVNQDFFETVKNYFNTKYIVFEFKNYREKITQKEIYTTEKYLYEKALRKVAVIISRFGADTNAMKAVRGCLRETGKLILCLSDRSLLDMVKIKEQGEREPAEFLDTVLDDMLVHLEK